MQRYTHTGRSASPRALANREREERERERERDSVSEQREISDERLQPRTTAASAAAAAAPAPAAGQPGPRGRRLGMGEPAGPLATLQPSRLPASRARPLQEAHQGLPQRRRPQPRQVCRPCSQERYIHRHLKWWRCARCGPTRDAVSRKEREREGRCFACMLVDSV